MTKYNMDGISDAYFGSSKQYNDYTKYIADREEEKRARQAAINEKNKRMSTISDSHYPNNEKNARMRDVSPAYNFGGSQYKKILGISDPAFSGGDEYVAYAEYLKTIAQGNEKPANDHPAVEAYIQTKTAASNTAGKRERKNNVPFALPEIDTSVTTNPYNEPVFMPKPLNSTVSNDPTTRIRKLSYAQQTSKDVEPSLTIGGLRKAEWEKEKLKKEIADIKAAYQNIEVEPIRPWTTLEGLRWILSSPILGDEVVLRYKNEWISANRDLIKEAANKYNIPVELLAGVAWSEVGGDPSWFDDYGYPARQYVRENIPEQLWWLLPNEFKKDPYKTSFGYVSMQVRVAAETLGISDEDLNAETAAEIIAALNDQKFSIFIAAKHLSNLKQIDFPSISSNELTIDDIATIASRYNIGAAASYERAATDSYGQRIKQRIERIMEFVSPE